MSRASFAGASQPVLSDTKLLKAVGAEILMQDAGLGVGYARITPQQQSLLLRKSHERGSCAGFEALATELTASSSDPEQFFQGLRRMNAQNQRFQASHFHVSTLSRRADIEAALKQVNENNLESWVKWFSSFTTRFHKSPTANQHVEQLKAKLDGMINDAHRGGVGFPVTVELIKHNSTPQNSIRVHIQGSTRPTEIVALGAHMDSINQSWGGKEAPGADDNASGSANLLETLRILLGQKQPERSIEFFWYAGEEAGLLGSAEIAKSYRAANRNVIAVLQLDMTLFPGSGEFVLGSMTDFTSAWLRSYFQELNKTYIGARIVDDKCGYGCSDHASWHRQQYPAVMPFESRFDDMNHNLHTARDTIDEKSNFRHSAMFSKLSLAYAMDLANSTAHQP